MTENTPRAYTSGTDDNKEFELAIPQWEAAVPKTWPLQIHEEGTYVPAAGRHILLRQGDRLKGGHAELMQGMLDQGFIREVTSDDIHG